MTGQPYDHMTIRTRDDGHIEVTMGPVVVTMTWVDAALHAGAIASAAVKAARAIGADHAAVQRAFSQAFEPTEDTP